jgi:hypothetical protein
MALGDRARSNATTRAPTAAPQEAVAPTCEECGADLDSRAARRSRQRYCSPRCRSRAYYREHRPVRLDRLEVDTVPLSPREAAMMAESAEAIARGDLISHEEVLAQLKALREHA